MKKLLATMLALTISLSGFIGCGAQNKNSAINDGKKTFILGDTTFNAENEEATINPHDTYCGWACIRYGVGETLFKFNNNMELEPWVADSYENVDDLTWKITLKDGVTFSNGKPCDAEAVKATLIVCQYLS